MDARVLLMDGVSRRRLIQMVLFLLVTTVFTYLSIMDSAVKDAFISAISVATLGMVSKGNLTETRTNDNAILLISGNNNKQCPGVLSHMMRGSWRFRALTPDEQRFIDDFLSLAISHQPVAKGWQRPDGLYGNVAQVTSGWHRALCDLKGQTPCCFENKCQNKTVEECKCPNCLDMRVRKHAEYSTWVPLHKDCKIKNFTTTEACDLLNGSAVYFAGDSLIRYIYTALSLLLTGNFYDGASKTNASKALHDQCTGMNVFRDVCEYVINYEITACNGHVKLNFGTYTASYHGEAFKRKYIPIILNNPKIWVLVGLGVHESYDANKMLNKFILPFWKKLTQVKATWPNVLWAASHCPGLEKPYPMKQDRDHAKGFNEHIKRTIMPYKIPIFDTFNVTDGITSLDGLHFGLGINLLKAQLFLNYIQEVKSRTKRQNNA